MNDKYKQRGGRIIEEFNLDCINQISENMPDNSIICDIGGYRAEFTVFCLELLDNSKIITEVEDNGFKDKDIE